MRRFWSYIKGKFKTIILCGLFLGIFSLILLLRNLPIGEIGYGVSLCAIVGIIFMIADYLQYYTKMNRLEEMLNQITINDMEFPRPEDLVEATYQEMVRALYFDKSQITNRMDNQYTDLVEYYSTWAHQIKTPIAAMRLMLQSTNFGESRELMNQLQRIEQYVEMVMCYLRLDSDSTDYVIRHKNLDDIVKQAIRNYASQFILKKIKLVYEPIDISILTDEKWLLFVIEQVLSNSLKYTTEGSIRIYLIGTATLCIEDTGMGIASEDLPRVFEKGYTGYNGRSEKKASGIGLYLCKRIIKKLGYSIEIESTVGKGTTVKIDLEVKERLYE